MEQARAAMLRAGAPDVINPSEHAFHSLRRTGATYYATVCHLPREAIARIGVLSPDSVPPPGVRLGSFISAGKHCFPARCPATVVGTMPPKKEEAPAKKCLLGRPSNNVKMGVSARTAHARARVATRAARRSGTR